MTKRPLIPSNADRLAPPYRPKTLVHSVPVNRANRLRPGLNLRQTLRWNGEATAFNPLNLRSNAHETVTDPTGSALSP